MARRLDLLGRRPVRSSIPDSVARSGAMSWDQYMSFVFQGNKFLTSSLGSNPEASFRSYVDSVGRRSGLVASAVAARAAIVSQTRFAWRNIDRRSDNYMQLFGTDQLRMLEHPDPKRVVTRPHLLSLAETHVSYAGAANFAIRNNRLDLLRPDLIDTVIVADDGATVSDVLAGHGEVAGWLYYSRGRLERPETFTVGEVAVWAPEPDPVAWWRGQSWLTSVMREIVTDGQVTEYVDRFLANGAAPSLIVRPDKSLTVDQMKEFKELFDEGHAGIDHAGSTLFLGGGSDVTVVGSKLGELAVREIQGGFETRIASRARVPAVVLGIREGMQGSALNAGNYGQTRRLWADGWATPTLESLCASLESLFPAPAKAELAHDAARMLFLQEDQKDAAEITATQATAIRALIDGGFEADMAVRAIRTGNLTALEGSHSGLVSVQLLEPGTGKKETS